MRFLHTSDWHVGKTLKTRSRHDEHRDVLHEILAIAQGENVDVLLLTGDLFDSSAPPPDAERLVYDFFSALCGLHIPAVVIGGNHDHPRRLLAIREILTHLNIHICPEPARPESGGVITITRHYETGVPGAEAPGLPVGKNTGAAISGSPGASAPGTPGFTETAKIAVLPFVAVGKISDATKLMSAEAERFQDYAERIGAMAEVLSQSFTPQTINILLAHLFVDNSITCGSERDIHVAKPYAVSAQRFPSTAHYIALGHLHRPQEIAAPAPACYAGSPLQLDFGEQGQEKRVVIIDAQPGKPAHIQSIPLTSGRKLRSISGSFEELESAVAAAGDEFLKVTINLDKPVPGIADRIREILPNALHINIDVPRPADADDTAVIAGADPNALFAAFYRRKYESDPPDEVARLFSELYEEQLDAAG